MDDDESRVFLVAIETPYDIPILILLLSSLFQFLSLDNGGRSENTKVQLLQTDSTVPALQEREYVILLQNMSSLSLQEAVEVLLYGKTVFSTH